MRGRGKGARFYWDETRWTSYVREHSPEEKARTEGSLFESGPFSPGAFGYRGWWVRIGRHPMHDRRQE